MCGSNGWPTQTIGSSPSFLRASQQPLVNQLHAFGVMLVGGFDFQGALEIVQDGQQGANGLGGGVFVPLGLFLFDAAAQILEFGLAAQKPVVSFGLFGGQLVPFRNNGGQRLRRVHDRSCVLFGFARSLRLLILLVFHTHNSRVTLGPKGPTALPQNFVITFGHVLVGGFEGGDAGNPTVRGRATAVAGASRLSFRNPSGRSRSRGPQPARPAAWSGEWFKWVLDSGPPFGPPGDVLKGLTKDDFTLLDDGKPQQIAVFRAAVQG